MKAIFLTMTLLATSIFLIAGSAQAFDATKSGGMSDYSKGMGDMAGRCPAGTCNQKGGPFARDVKQCSAANCKGKAGK